MLRITNQIQFQLFFKAKRVLLSQIVEDCSRYVNKRPETRCYSPWKKFSPSEDQMPKERGLLQSSPPQIICAQVRRVQQGKQHYTSRATDHSPLILTYLKHMKRFSEDYQHEPFKHLSLNDH